MTIGEAARRWARTWESAWNAGDVESIVALYAPGALFSSEPVRAVYRGPDGVREYVTGAFGGEEQVTARFGEPVVGADRVAVPWWTTLTEGGTPTTLAGTSLLRFDEDGRVLEQWDTCNQLAERRDPPAGWR